ncbi:MAG: SMODS domain-containing nucleotidyltransferase [Gaiellales bacterium]
MKHVARFDSFLADTVNLNQSRLDDLDDRVRATVGYLREDEAIGGLIRGQIPQGSWAHRTIIKPLPGDEFDADVLLHMDNVYRWVREPGRYVDEVDRAFRRSGRYCDAVERKRRCVRIRYANFCHIDIVPYVRRGLLGEKVIVNRAENRFEPTDPEAFTAWMRRQDGRSNGNLRKTIRLYKYLRDRNDAFTIPSIILTTLLGKQLHWYWDAPSSYPDLPTAFKILTDRLDGWLERCTSLPRIPDPSGSGASFDHRWNDRSFRHFQGAIHTLRSRVNAAYDEKKQITSVLLWRRILGPGF